MKLTEGMGEIPNLRAVEGAWLVLIRLSAPSSAVGRDEFTWAKETVKKFGGLDSEGDAVSDRDQLVQYLLRRHSIPSRNRYELAGFLDRLKFDDNTSGQGR